MDDAFPGWVEARLSEADGTVVVLTDKVSVFGLDDVTADNPLPVPVELACEVLRYERPSQRGPDALADRSALARTDSAECLNLGR